MGIVPEQRDASMGRAYQAQDQLDQRALAGAVVPGQRDALAFAQSQVQAVDGPQPAIVLADARKGHKVGVHGVSFGFAASGAGGFISGALSMTPPGSRAGNCDCAHRTMEMAGLFSRMRAEGARHSNWPTTSLGRYAVSAMPSPSRSKAVLSLQ
ncbi:hypothetical protein D3C72_1834770 [compost metagenome]